MITTIVICAIIFALCKVIGKSPATRVDRVEDAAEKFMNFQKQLQAKYTQEEWDEACKQLQRTVHPRA